MTAEFDVKESNDNVLSGHTIYIIGSYLFHNETLAFALESKTAAQCLCVNSIADVPDSPTEEHHKELLLCDLCDKNLNEFISDLLPSVENISDSRTVAMFNVRQGLGIEERCMNHGVRGVFYENDSVNVFLKGISAISSGELWFSRGAMTKYILEEKDNITSLKVRSILTQREIEIISLVAVGSKNDEIADKLCVSPHTIKTHLYNIYKKIDVSNRLQATLWAANNL